MLKSENLQNDLGEVATFLHNTLWKKIKLCIIGGYVAAKMSFVFFGGNIYLTTDDFDPDMCPIWQQRVFRVSSIVTLPIHLLLAIVSVVAFFALEILFPALMFVIRISYGLSMLAIESLQRFVPNRVVNQPAAAAIHYTNHNASPKSTALKKSDGSSNVHAENHRASLHSEISTANRNSHSPLIPIHDDPEKIQNTVNNDLAVRGAIKKRRKRPNGVINQDVFSDLDN